MGTQKMLPLIISFSLPSIISMTAIALYNVVDTIFVGRLGTEAIAGLTLILPLQMFVLAFGLLIGVGAMSYISRSLGAKEYERANHVFSSAVFLGLIVGVFITLLGFSQLKPLLDVIGRNSGAIPQAYDYGFIIVFGIPVMVFNLILSQCARAEGNPNIAMTSQLTGTFLNIALDPIFIFTLKMGIKGAALATVLANTIALIVILVYFTGPKSHLKFKLKLVLPTKKILQELAKSGIPSFTRHIAASFVITLTNSFLAVYGAFALAIMGINSRLMMLFFMPIIGTGQGFMPIAGFNYGARNLTRVKEAFWTTFKIVTVFCTLGWILIQVFPGFFIKIFSRDPLVISQGIPALRMILAFLPLVGFQIIGAVTYQAIGRGLAGFVLSIARQVLVFLPVVLVFKALFGLKGIFLTYPAADLGATLVTAFWLRHTFKKFSASGGPTRGQGKMAKAAGLFVILTVVLLLVNCGHSEKIERFTGKKQIVLISIDTLRADHLGCYGYQRDTSPALDKFAAEAVRYSGAYPNCSWTIPSHVSLLTGTLPSRHGITKTWKEIAAGVYPQVNEVIKNAAQILKQQGNIKTIKYAKLPDGLGFGKGFDINRLVDPFADDKIFNRLLAQFEKNKDKDFFFFIHTWRVHSPYTSSYFLENEKIDPETRRYIDNFREIHKENKDAEISKDFLAFVRAEGLFNLRDCVDLYDGGIHYVDRYIGRLIAKTKALGIYDDLFFIITSDHGEHFAEHFPNQFYCCHGTNFFEEFIKVPLLIKYPRTAKSKTIDYPVSLIDVLPTLLDYYRVDIPAYVQGESLLQQPTREVSRQIISEGILLSSHEKKMIRIGDLKYIIVMKQPEKPERVNWRGIVGRRLYDLKKDPLEKNNLYEDKKFRQICIDFEKILMRAVKDSAKVDKSMKEVKISADTVKQLKALGYL